MKQARCGGPQGTRAVGAAEEHSSHPLWDRRMRLRGRQTLAQAPERASGWSRTQGQTGVGAQTSFQLCGLLGSCP